MSGIDGKAVPLAAYSAHGSSSLDGIGSSSGSEAEGGGGSTMSQVPLTDEKSSKAEAEDDMRKLVEEYEREQKKRKCKCRKDKRGCWGCSCSCSCLRGCGSTFRDNVKEIQKSPRDLLVLYSIAFLDSLSYYAFSYALIMHLGKEVGLPDESAGLFYGIFGVCITIATLVLGFVVDMLGLRLSMCFSAAAGLVTRLGMSYAVLAHSSKLTALILFFGVGPSIALMGPVIPTAVKRYTTSKTRNFGFSIYYGVMNMAAFLATPVVDLIRLHTQSDVLLLPPYALLIAGTAIMQIPVFFAAIFGIRDLNLSDDGVTLAPLPSRAESGDTSTLSSRVTAMLQNKNFWRAVCIVVALVGVKSTFRYMDALYLTYVIRSFPDANTFPYLSLLSLNPAIVITVTITGVITLLTSRFHPVNSMIVGSFLGGFAPAFMAIGPYTIAVILWILFTSIGEVIWSPVTYTYLVGLAVDGDEGAWMAIAGMPLFLAKMLTGVLTGSLMTRFCPDPALSVVYFNGTATTPAPAPPQLGGNPQQCWSAAIWGIITLTTASSFFMLLAMRRFVSVPVAPKQSGDGSGAIEFVVVKEEGQEGLDGVLRVEYGDAEDDEDLFPDHGPVEDFGLPEDIAAVITDNKKKRNKLPLRT